MFTLLFLLFFRRRRSTSIRDTLRKFESFSVTLRDRGELTSASIGTISDSDTPWELACCEELAIDFSELFLIANDGEGWSAVSWAVATFPNIV